MILSIEMSKFAGAAKTDQPASAQDLLPKALNNVLGDHSRLIKQDCVDEHHRSGRADCKFNVSSPLRRGAVRYNRMRRVVRSYVDGSIHIKAKTLTMLDSQRVGASDLNAE